ncbi:MAG: hypothetical protein ACLP0L_15535 [Solirubrobacteraceae bacterium]
MPARCGLLLSSAARYAESISELERRRPSDDVRAVQMRGGRQLPHPLRSGTGLAQRVQDRQPKRLRIVLLAPHRHPRRALAQTRRGDPARNGLRAVAEEAQRLLASTERRRARSSARST